MALEPTKWSVSRGGGGTEELSSLSVSQASPFPETRGSVIEVSSSMVLIVLSGDLLNFGLSMSVMIGFGGL